MMQRKQLLGEGNQQRCPGSDDNGEGYAIDVLVCFLFFLFLKKTKNQQAAARDNSESQCVGLVGKIIG